MLFAAFSGNVDPNPSWGCLCTGEELSSIHRQRQRHHQQPLTAGTPVVQDVIVAPRPSFPPSHTYRMNELKVLKPRIVLRFPRKRAAELPELHIYSARGECGYLFSSS